MAGDAPILRELLDAMARGRLLPERAFAPDADTILRMRETPEFEAAVTPLFAAVSNLLRDTPREDLEYIEDFVEKVFVHVFERTGSDDLSAYVSDDFGLLAQALHVGYEDQQLNGLAHAYGQSSVPCARIAPVAGSLLDHMRKVARP